MSLGNDATGNVRQYIGYIVLQGGIQIGGQVGEPYGVIRGHKFVRDVNGEKVLRVRSGSSMTMLIIKGHQIPDLVIGDINPDWPGSVRNSFSFKDFDLSFPY